MDESALFAEYIHAMPELKNCVPLIVFYAYLYIVVSDIKE